MLAYWLVCPSYASCSVGHERIHSTASWPWIPTRNNLFQCFLASLNTRNRWWIEKDYKTISVSTSHCVSGMVGVNKISHSKINTTKLWHIRRYLFFAFTIDRGAPISSRKFRDIYIQFSWFENHNPVMFVLQEGEHLINHFQMINSRKGHHRSKRRGFHY